MNGYEQRGGGRALVWNDSPPKNIGIIATTRRGVDLKRLWRDYAPER